MLDSQRGFADSIIGVLSNDVLRRSDMADFESTVPKPESIGNSSAAAGVGDGGIQMDFKLEDKTPFCRLRAKPHFEVEDCPVPVLEPISASTGKQIIRDDADEFRSIAKRAFSKNEACTILGL